MPCFVPSFMPRPAGRAVQPLRHPPRTGRSGPPGLSRVCGRSLRSPRAGHSCVCQWRGQVRAIQLDASGRDDDGRFPAFQGVPHLHPGWFLDGDRVEGRNRLGVVAVGRRGLSTVTRPGNRPRPGGSVELSVRAGSPRGHWIKTGFQVPPASITFGGCAGRPLANQERRPRIDVMNIRAA